MKVPGQAQPGTKLEVPLLPKGVTLSQVYSELIEYMYNRTMDFFVESTPNGRNIWERLQSKIALVFCTPNGWDISQHVFIRDAVMAVNLVPPSEAEERISFITEGEASVHYVLSHTRINIWLNKGGIFAVVDVGGSTVDSTLYECKETQPLRLEEVCASECVQVRHAYLEPQYFY
jgi:hypothetical protein